MTLLQLFISFFQVGLFSVGGGYAAVPLIQDQIVDSFHWLTVREFSDLLTIAEMTPGPIAVNSATFVGTRIAGFPGALIATLGCILPSLLLVSALGVAYHKYGRLYAVQTVLATMRPAVAALIASAFLTILLNVVFVSEPAGQKVDVLATVLFVGALVAIRIRKKNAILTMLACGVLYTLSHLLIQF